MADPIYFSKIEFREVIGYVNTSSIILLNIPEKELSYQVFNWNRQMPAIEGRLTEEYYEHILTYDFAMPAKIIRNGKSYFEPQIIMDEQYEQEVTFSYAIKLTNEQMNALLPYCNSLDFEPFRGKKMKMTDEGYVGYRDEVQLYFKAITDSYIPLLELPMNYYYDEEHIWPSEKLYRYLVKTFFHGKKKLRGWEPTYGGCSLFF